MARKHRRELEVEYQQLTRNVLPDKSTVSTRYINNHTGTFLIDFESASLLL